MKIGRNEPCSCGSGIKYKHCCISKRIPSSPEPSSPLTRLLMGVVAIGIAGTLSWLAFFREDGAGSATPIGNLQFPPPGSLVSGQAPPGPAPAGQVWSPEHNHFHPVAADAGIVQTTLSDTTTSITTTPGTTTAQLPAFQASPGPQPDGPVPPGKVWSPEHGHWHDVPATTPVATTPPPTPSNSNTASSESKP